MIKKLCKSFLFPHMIILIILTPISTVFLVHAMVFCAHDSIFSIISYVLAFYTLMVWCVRIPRLITYFKSFRKHNKYLQYWKGNTHLRVNVSLSFSLLCNTAYAVFQLALGLRHHSFWFYSLALYYISLVIMRIFLLHHTRKHNPGAKMLDELIKYRFCGIVFLVMNVALTLIIFFMVYWNRTFIHHEITTIAMAAYTFTSLTLAIINVIKYRKFGSPVYSASKAISLASACVSVLTLESTMLTTFGDATMGLTERRIFLGGSGAAVSAYIIIMAIFMIVKSSKEIKRLKISNTFSRRLP